jgi:hypothetical protein
MYGLTNWKYPQAPKNVIFTNAEFLISQSLYIYLSLYTYFRDKLIFHFDFIFISKYTRITVCTLKYMNICKNLEEKMLKFSS